MPAHHVMSGRRYEGQAYVYCRGVLTGVIVFFFNSPCNALFRPSKSIAQFL